MRTFFVVAELTSALLDLESDGAYSAANGTLSM